MDGTNLTKEEFLECVKDHKIKIIRDDGLYRHIELRNKNGSFNQYFHLITWPGYLAYTGDMGCFVFSRIDDMFSFFRGNDINPGYWAEKVEAENIHGGIREFSVEEFRNAVLAETRSYLEIEEVDEIPEDIMDEIEPLLEASDECECVSAMRDFDSELITFTDFWENSLTRGTYHYKWACYAIQWAIQKYDETKYVYPIAKKIMYQTHNHEFWNTVFPNTLYEEERLFRDLKALPHVTAIKKEPSDKACESESMARDIEEDRRHGN
jgi:hypothetical protein